MMGSLSYKYGEYDSPAYNLAKYIVNLVKLGIHHNILRFDNLHNI